MLSKTSLKENLNEFDFYQGWKVISRPASVIVAFLICLKMFEAYIIPKKRKKMTLNKMLVAVGINIYKYFNIII